MLSLARVKREGEEGRRKEVKGGKRIGCELGSMHKTLAETQGGPGVTWSQAPSFCNEVLMKRTENSSF